MVYSCFGNIVEIGECGKKTVCDCIWSVTKVWEGAILPVCPFSSFACPKEETRKRHPSQSWPCGLPLLLAEGGPRKNSGFALRQFPRLFPPPSARRGRTNGGEEKSHWHAAEHRKSCRKGRLHCLSAASLQHPGSFEERRASRPRRDKRHGCLFFGSFLWASKEMNRRIKRITLAAELDW
jgi:hypothetical protein